MPCIKKTKSESGSIWKAYCGKTVWYSNNAFDTPEQAIRDQKEQGKGICPTCRKNAKLPAPERKKKEEFVTYSIYSVANGMVAEHTVIKETRTGLRLSDGNLKSLGKSRAIKLVGDDVSDAARQVLYTKSKDEAFKFAEEQLECIREFALSLIEFADNRSKKVSNQELAK